MCVATLNALNTLIAGMSKLPGRKISVFISEGFRSCNADVIGLSDTINRAARAKRRFILLPQAALSALAVSQAM